MKLTHILATMVIAAVHACAASAGTTDTALTYQGELKQNGSPANGEFDMQFTLWDAPEGGNQVGPFVTRNNVPVIDGLFTVELDFTGAPFISGPRWLRVRIEGEVLSPRQAVTSAPFSISTRGLMVNGADTFTGIGRANPISNVERFGVHSPATSGYGGMYVSTAGEGAQPFYGYSTGGDFNVWHYYDGATKKWHLYFNGRRLTVLSNGDVGIGTETPTHRLHVVDNTGGQVVRVEGAGGLHAIATSLPALIGWSDGTSAIQGACTNASGYDFYANGAGINYGSPSSIRWKRDVQPIANPLGKLESIRGVSFMWDKDHGGQRDVGFIGEEVGAVLPEIVAFEDDSDFVTGMDYSKVTPLLVEALKAVRAEHEAELAALRDEKDGQIADLQRQIDELRAMLHTPPRGP